MRHSNDQDRKDQRRNDHLDQAQKNVGKQGIAGDRLGRLRIRPQLVAGLAHGDAEHHAEKNDHRQSLGTHALPMVPLAQNAPFGGVKKS
jgi:hypothetical protein